MNEFQSKTPDFFNPYQIVDVKDIIQDIKPPLPLESNKLYRNIRPSGVDGVARDIKRGISESIKLKEFLKTFSGQIVVEIGPGDTITGYEIALLSGARSYVGVEPYHYIGCLREFVKHDTDSLNKKLVRIPHTIVEADALSFLRRLPDQSVSVFASQLNSVMKKEYETAVAKEIQRVLHSQGALIAYDSKFDLDKNLFKYDLYDRKSDDDTYLYFELERYQLKK